MPQKKSHYGWIPDVPDHRDHMYGAPLETLKRLPAHVDLRPKCPPVLDQGNLGSCTANAISNAYRFDEMKQKLDAQFQPSRLFIYYNERSIEGTVASDSGAMIRDGIKSISKQGVCAETTWPYDITRFELKPPSKAYTQAKKHQAVSYERVTQSLAQMRGCLADGYPFVCGFTVYESFESKTVAKTGVVPMPTLGERALGGHAVLCVGYEDATQRFMIMNSWSPSWGDKGFCTMPYAYLVDSDYASDFWTVRLVES